jgi:hypothetical protein
MSTTSLIAAGAVLAGALIAALFLPARARSRSIPSLAELPEPAAA